MTEPLPAPEEEEAFAPGQVLEGRFQIVREVARGGMGVVYEARDQKLDRRIALKCAKVAHRHHLSREARNATEVSHPNVCKIYEIHTAATSSGDVDCITMEFLDGETLSARMRRAPLSRDEAQAIPYRIRRGLLAGAPPDGCLSNRSVANAGLVAQ